MAKKYHKNKHGGHSSVDCDIEEIYGFISPNEDKIFARISWNNRPAKNEIRKCWVDRDGEIHLGAGLSLTDSEIDTLARLAKGAAAAKAKATPVNFDKIFASSEGIVEKREAGFKTEDGFIILRKRNHSWN